MGGEMPESAMRLHAYFFATARGAEPVRDWLKGLDQDDRRRIGADIATVEYGWPVGMPVCRSLGGGLWEVRSDLSRSRIARVIFCVESGTVVLLNGFIKKTRTTPKAELELARSRKREMER